MLALSDAMNIKSNIILGIIGKSVSIIGEIMGIANKNNAQVSEHTAYWPHLYGQLIATLKFKPSLTIVNWSAFPECFVLTM